MHLTEQAHELGVDGFLVVTPYYNKPPPRGIVEHFKAIAAVSDKPIVVYNIPARVVLNIEPETMAKLAEIPTVKAVKQANDDLDQARLIPGFGLDLYAGDDNLIFPFLGLGGVGGVCVHTHVWGPQTKEMVRRYKDGDVAGARRLNEEMAPAFDLQKVATNPIAIKAAVNLLGHDVGGLRLPLVEANESEQAVIRSCLAGTTAVTSSVWSSRCRCRERTSSVSANPSRPSPATDSTTPSTRLSERTVNPSQRVSQYAHTGLSLGNVLSLSTINTPPVVAAN